MAEIIGFIGTPLEARTSEQSGMPYFSFRLAENCGTGKRRKTTWYNVRATISKVKAAELSSGQPVRVRGRLDSQGYVRNRLLQKVRVPRSWDAILRVLKEHDALDTSIVLITSSVEPYQFPLREDEQPAA